MNRIYSSLNSTLTKNQQDFFENNGYLLIKNNMDHNLLEEVRQRFLDICNNKVDRGFMTLMKEQSLQDSGVTGEYVINKVQDILFDDILWKYCCAKSVVDIVESIIGPNITAVHSMLINKPPDANPESSLHPLHQDMYYFPFRPANKIVAAWTAMENVDENNGCLYVIPGTHRDDYLHKHDYGEKYRNKFYHGIHHLNHLQRVSLPMEKGDTVFFHPLLLHGSGPNTTKGFRKSISCHYADSNCHFIDVRGTIQEAIGKEIVDLSKKRGVDLSYVEIWKYKSRLVRGAPGNFQSINSHM